MGLNPACCRLCLVGPGARYKLPLHRVWVQGRCSCGRGQRLPGGGSCRPSGGGHAGGAICSGWGRGAQRLTCRKRQPRLWATFWRMCSGSRPRLRYAVQGGGEAWWVLGEWIECGRGDEEEGCVAPHLCPRGRCCDGSVAGWSARAGWLRLGWWQVRSVHAGRLAGVGNVARGFQTGWHSLSKVRQALTCLPAVGASGVPESY